MSGKLRRLVAADPELEVITGQGGDLQLFDGYHITFTPRATATTRKFFRWWRETLLKNRREKIDELTGAFTRSYWERSLKMEYDNPSGYSTAMVDIDHFKRFNDLYGHQTGDRVLEAVGERLLHLLPESVEVIRYGGEEFLLILSGFTAESARKLLEEFRRSLSENLLYKKQPEKITVSIGLNSSQLPEGTPEQMIGRADLALYEAKRNGRDRLEIYAPHLNRKDNYYVWGIYRYFRGKNRRVFLGQQNLLVNLEDSLYLYNWSLNAGRELLAPPQLKKPLNYAAPQGEDYLVLDSEGEIWKISAGGDFQKLTQPETPTFVKLFGEHDRIFAVGINNQLYRIGKSATRFRSLPEKWQFITSAGGDEIYYVHENRLCSLQSSETTFRLPARAAYVSSGTGSIYLTGVSGRGFRFDSTEQHWSKLKIINMEPNSIYFKKIQSTGRRLLIRDRTGRLLFCRRRRKSVPQEMSLLSA